MPNGYNNLFLVFIHKYCSISNISKYHKYRIHGLRGWNRGSVSSVVVNRFQPYFPQVPSSQTAQLIAKIRTAVDIFYHT